MKIKYKVVLMLDVLEDRSSPAKLLPDLMMDFRSDVIANSEKAPTLFARETDDLFAVSDTFKQPLAASSTFIPDSRNDLLISNAVLPPSLGKVG